MESLRSSFRNRSRRRDNGLAMSEVLALNASPSPTSKTHAIAVVALEIAGGGDLLELSALDADALLGRSRSNDVEDAKKRIAAADIVVVASPVYRATYSGLLKVLLDQFDQRALEGVVCVLAATGGSAQHFLAVDTGLRPLVTSLAATAVPTAVYAESADFDEAGQPSEKIRQQLTQAIAEAKAIAASVRASDQSSVGVEG